MTTCTRLGAGRMSDAYLLLSPKENRDRFQGRWQETWKEVRMERKKRNRTPLAAARYAAGFTQAGIAEEIGLTVTTVHTIENRPQDCSDKAVLKFIDALPGNTDNLKRWVFDVKMHKRLRQLESSFGNHAKL